MKITEVDADKQQHKKHQKKRRKEMLREKEQKLSKHSVHDREKFGNIPEGARRRRRKRREAFEETDLGRQTTVRNEAKHAG